MRDAASEASAKASDLTPQRRRLVIWLLVFGISWSVTLTNQMWVGRSTIYSDSKVDARERLHGIVFANRLPDGVPSWSSIGANGMNVRVLTVWVAEGLHRATGQPLARCYWALETAALFLCCLLLFAFVQSCTGTGFAFCALLFYGSVLPLTYLFHYFHPWDKPSLAAWLGALICARHQRWGILAVVLTVGMFIKYDLIIFPLLVFLAERRHSGWRKSLTVAASLFLLALSVHVFLRWIVPGGFEPRPWIDQVALNLRGFRMYPLQYPPFLALGIPALLAAVGYSRADDFARAGIATAAVMVVLFFFQVNFVEFRTQVALLPLLLPGAAYGARRLIGAPGEERLSRGDARSAELGTR